MAEDWIARVAQQIFDECVVVNDLDEGAVPSYEVIVDVSAIERHVREAYAKHLDAEVAELWRVSGEGGKP
jgi:hypothetical protein